MEEIKIGIHHGPVGHDHLCLKRGNKIIGFFHILTDSIDWYPSKDYGLDIKQIEEDIEIDWIDVRNPSSKKNFRLFDFSLPVGSKSEIKSDSTMQVGERRNFK